MASAAGTSIGPLHLSLSLILFSALSEGPVKDRRGIQKVNTQGCLSACPSLPPSPAAQPPLTG